MLSIQTLVYLIVLVTVARCSDITPAVFGNVLDGMPAAFGDFNSDELTDVFMLRGKPGDSPRTVEIFLAADQEPLLRPAPHLNCSFKNNVTSVVPGDFDGDVFMDILVTTFNRTDKLTYVHILWGGNGHLNCSNESLPLIKMRDQPLALDYNQDMIIDLFGVDQNNNRTFWIFNEDRTPPTPLKMESKDKLKFESVRIPHSNAFLDLNNDFLSDLVVTTKKSFEIWFGTEIGGFEFSHYIHLPYNALIDQNKTEFGQTLYLDIELTGKMALLLPLCFNEECTNCTIMMYQNSSWHNLEVNFRDLNNVMWGFVKPNGHRYTETITLRGGDFNMDGYPDLLATLQSSSGKQSFLLQNVACKTCTGFNRTFEVKWQALNPFYNETAMAVFYDFYQDGILDVILVEYDKTSNSYRTAAFKNSLDYDANFVKVMVLTGRTNSMYPISPGSLGKKKRTYGTNLPGPSIAYRTTTQDGSPRNAIAAQLPQSAHFSLNLPYTTFGLGRTPNFVDALTIGVGGKSREWPQIIPNSQMVVIPNPIAEPSRWKAQLFVTPSKLILLSAAALTGTCGLITAIILGLYWKERREDKIEKLQEAHRFHFDAM